MANIDICIRKVFLTHFLFHWQDKNWKNTVLSQKLPRFDFHPPGEERLGEKKSEGHLPPATGNVKNQNSQHLRKTKKWKTNSQPCWSGHHPFQAASQDKVKLHMEKETTYLNIINPLFVMDHCSTTSIKYQSDVPQGPGFITCTL